ncbi:MAG: type II toxin-antitoxin system RatA family toxin [Pseudomonadota bacterium]
MTSISRNALVPYSPAEMFALVDDIDAYPSFLPWCRRAQVLLRDGDQVKATISLAKRGLEFSFTTCNRLQQDKMIEMRLMEGPFRHLQGFWRFEPLRKSACRVSLDLEFELSNHILRLTITPIFTQITNSLVGAFVKRAQEVYGQR